MSKTTQPPGTTPESDADFDAAIARIGHSVLPQRRKGLMAGYVDMKRQAAIIRREPLGAATEPSNTFSLVPFLTAPQKES